MDEYITNVKQYIKDNPDLTEEEIVMYVYLDLASRLSFDPEFFFGGSKKKSEIYYKASKKDELNKCFNNHKIICKSSAYILEYILKSLGINIVTNKDASDGQLNKYAHVFNTIYPKDGSKSYIVDLQNDLSNVHFHSFTSFFGKDVDNINNYVISPNRIKQIHTKLGYISDANPYLDDYINQFIIYMPSDFSFSEKLDVILKNIEPNKFANVSYWERRWKHEYILRKALLNVNVSNKVQIIEFYKNNGDEIVYNNGYYIFINKGLRIYYYNIDNYQYESYDVLDFAHKVIDEDIHYNQQIRMLDRAVNELKEISKEKVKKIQM